MGLDSPLTIPLTIALAKDGEGARVEKISVPNLYVEEITHFSNCILRGMEPISPGANGVANQRVLDEAMRGMKQP